MEGMHKRNCKPFFDFKQCTNKKPVLPLHDQVLVLIRTLIPVAFHLSKYLHLSQEQRTFGVPAIWALG